MPWRWGTLTIRSWFSRWPSVDDVQVSSLLSFGAGADNDSPQCSPEHEAMIRLTSSPDPSPLRGWRIGSRLSHLEHLPTLAKTKPDSFSFLLNGVLWVTITMEGVALLNCYYSEGVARPRTFGLRLYPTIYHCEKFVQFLRASTSIARARNSCLHAYILWAYSPGTNLATALATPPKNVPRFSGSEKSLHSRTLSSPSSSTREMMQTESYSCVVPRMVEPTADICAVVTHCGLRRSDGPVKMDERG